MINLPVNATEKPVEDTRRTIEASDMGELAAEAQRRIEEAADDPTVQSYFLRQDTNTVIKTEEEYLFCTKRGISIKVIPYGHARDVLKREDALKNQEKTERQRRKAARKARKKNRS